MPYYMKTANRTKVVNSKNVNVAEGLPVGTYVAGFNPDDGYYLTDAPDFVLPKKTYGSPKQDVERVFRSYTDRKASTGVLLVGAKGSGKTLLSKMISIEGARRGMSTIIVTSQLCGDGFNQFIQSIDTECVIIFDEFEKVYDSVHQPYLLTLFDGLYASKKLFVLTSNDKHKIDSHIFNRPGRMYYFLEYDGLNEDFIREYCADVLLDKNGVEDVVKLSVIYDQFNFDLLQAICEEMNRYGERAKEVIRFLNAKPEIGTSYYEVSAFDEETGKKYEYVSDSMIRVDPFNFHVFIDVGNYKKNAEKARGRPKNMEQIEKFKEIAIRNSDYWKIDVSSKSIIFKVDGDVVALTRAVSKQFDYYRDM